MNGGKRLCNAKEAKDDEWYTQYHDVDRELGRFAKHFEGKWVHSPCDGEKSNIVKWFNDKFHDLDMFGYSHDIVDMLTDPLVEQCDIVVTNPPFSKIRVLVDHLVGLNKNFILFAPLTAAAYVRFFELYKYKWLHYVRLKKSGLQFLREDGTIKGAPTMIISTLDVDDRPDIHELAYENGRYDRIDGTDILFIKRIKDIPTDYYGEMVVPVTFPGTFKNEGGFNLLGIIQRPRVNGKTKYTRFVIQKGMCGGCTEDTQDLQK